jgi:NAD(P) transhydrogenase
MPAQDDSMNRRLDVVVIGAGPAGEAAALLAGNLGYSVALVEQDTVGGTVVTNGGAPTKTFREAAVYLSAFEKEKVYGIALSVPPEVMYPAVRARAHEVSEQLRQLALARIRASGVQLVHGTAWLNDDHTVVAQDAGDREMRLRAERVIIATGSRPLRPASVPFDDVCVFDSETITDIARKPRELLIVGGGAIGVEYATIFSALGVPVTILDGASRLAAVMDGEISRRLEQVFLARGNQVVLGTGMASVRRDGDDLITELTDGRQLRPDALLFAAGRRVSTGGLGLERVGVEVDTRGRVIVDAERRTSCPWVFAAGDVISPTLASTATDQGRQALCGALGLDFSVHVDQIPAAAVYGLPEVARAGRSEEDCQAEGIPYKTGRCELGATPRGVISGQDGLIKLVIHAGTGVLLGVHVIGDIASEIVGIGQAMLHSEATVEDVARMVYNTPTYSYGYKLAAADSLSRLDPAVLQAMLLPSRADRI